MIPKFVPMKSRSVLQILLFSSLLGMLSCGSPENKSSSSNSSGATDSHAVLPESGKKAIEGELLLGPEVRELHLPDGQVLLIENPEALNQPDYKNARSVKAYAVKLEGTQTATDNYLAAIMPFSFHIDRVVSLEASKAQPEKPLRLMQCASQTLKGTVNQGGTSSHLFEVVVAKSKVSLALKGASGLYFSVFKNGRSYVDKVTSWEAVFNEPSIFTVKVFGDNQRNEAYDLVVTRSK